MFSNIYRNKTVLITGHTGFKGSWLSIWLKELGANVVGYALEPYTNRDNFVVTGLENKITHIIGDVRNYKKLKEVFLKCKPEFIFHLAAQPIVRESYLNPKETYDVNVGGTVNVFECCRLTNYVKVIINVTSDKCYENKEWIWGYRENDPMGGYDPYSSSKGCSELITAAYLKSFFNPKNYNEHGKSISSVRAGNVIGGGDWQKDRLIPDCIRTLENNEVIKLRNPYSTRPWQHVLEPLSGYLLLASKMYQEPGKFYGAWNFGPNYDSIISVREIVCMLVEKWGNGKWLDISDESEPHEANLLSLDVSKARNILNWQPEWNIQKCIDKTVEWYKNYNNKNVYEICLNQIDTFVQMYQF
ncbi:MAG: CDP-glucose 4,6-dehydratase [Candidatus Marinimicrobia bacterium]|nr:CDP-glucose 4,6-dehydratase [Candidatus Neomarinimicrobiota bacterium]